MHSCVCVCNMYVFIYASIFLCLYPFSSGSSWPRNQTGVSCIAGGFFISWATGKPKEGWAPKNCFWTMMKTFFKSPLDSKEIKPVTSKGNQSWIFIRRTDAETEAPIIWPPDVMSQLTGKDSDAGKDWGQEEKGVTEDEMVEQHHWLNGHEFEPTLGDNKDREAWRATVHAVLKN